MALDGGTVRFTAGAFVDLQRPATSVATFGLGKHRQEFTSGPRSFGRAVAVEVGIAGDLDSYHFEGGSLTLGSADMHEPRTLAPFVLQMAFWEGIRYSVHTHLYGGGSEDLLGILSRFKIEEGPLGVRMIPRDPSGTPLMGHTTLLKELTGLGLASVSRLNDELAKQLPADRGSEVSGGELFLAREGEEAEHLVLIGETARTILMPDTVGVAGNLLPQVEGMTVEWENPK